MSEILRYIDSIARDKQIDPEGLIVAIENAVAQALAKKYGIDDLVIELDRDTGEWNTNYEIDLEQEGRILATTVRQSITSRLREQERDVLFNEAADRLQALDEARSARHDLERSDFELLFGHPTSPTSTGSSKRR